MAWSKNNVAHRRLHGALVALRQYQQTYLFPDAGKVKMKELRYWPGDGAGPDIVELRAGEISMMIDGVMNQFVLDAKYEAGFNEISAPNHLKTVLKNGEKTVADLGDALDEGYDFVGEDDAR